jgi:hypothetical protein
MGQAHSPDLSDSSRAHLNHWCGERLAWLRDIPTYGRIRYKAVYPSVDVVWYGTQGRLEYDLDLQPGAGPNKIAMRFEGARRLSVEASGDPRGNGHRRFVYAIHQIALAFGVAFPKDVRRAEGSLPAGIEGPIYVSGNRVWRP